MKILQGPQCGLLKERPLRALITLVWAILFIQTSSLHSQAPPLITEFGYQSGNPFLSLAVADFNGDGIPDVAVASFLGSAPGTGIMVYLGNGDGTFKPPISYLLDADFAGNAFLAGDFNGDGKPDLCVADTVGNLWVLLGNGDGTFQTPVSTSLGGGKLYVATMAAADFNGDGKLDVAITALSQEPDSLGEVLVLLGNGDGTFAAPTTAISGPFSPQKIVAADFAQNGNADIAFLGDAGLTVVGGDGAGGFGAPTTYQIQSEPAAQSLVEPFTLVLADVNGDGIPDLVTGLSDMYLVEAFLGNGDGTFKAGIVTTLGSGLCCSYLSSMAAADFNGDGNIDLFWGSAGNSPSVLLLGNGDGTFQAPNPLVMDWGTYDLQAWVAAAVDLNGDHRPDVVFATPNEGGWLVSVLNTQGTVGVSILPQKYDFGQQTVGAPAASTTVTIGNPGTTAMSFSNLQVDDTTDFSTTTTCGSSVAPAAICAITVTFNPQSTGEKTASVSFATNDSLVATATISVMGDAIAPVASTSPSLVQFSYQKVGTTSSSQTVQITNSGIGPLILAISVQGDFAQTNNCPATLAQGANCAATIAFAPEVPGSEVGRLVINSNANPAQSAVALTGVGYIIGPVFSLSPATVDFGSQYVGTSSAPAVVTVANTGDAPFNISSVTASAGFVPLSTCGSNVQPSFSCAIGIFFDPSTTGSQSGELTIVDNLPASQQLVALSGNGTQISVDAAAGSSTAQVVNSGQSATFGLNIAPVSGYTGTVNFVCTGLPQEYTCKLSQGSATLNGSAPATVEVSVAPTTTSAATKRETTLYSGSGGMLLACPVLIIFAGAGLLPRWRRRLLSIGVVAIFAAVAGSCGGTSTPHQTSSQTYVFLLQSQPASSITIDTPLTLTVNQ
jgi:FG-GAP-like repeat/Abnormal spindle-like microcephaly-assoc'd, ASPM-SPD-2-Hydin/FG-GAP repeat